MKLQLIPPESPSMRRAQHRVRTVAAVGARFA